MRRHEIMVEMGENDRLAQGRMPQVVVLLESTNTGGYLVNVTGSGFLPLER
jgi:hypothetical protein